MAIPGLNIDPVALTNGTTMFITAIVLLMVIAIGGLASYAYMQFRAHNVTVEILVGDGQVGTMRRDVDAIGAKVRGVEDRVTKIEHVGIDVKWKLALLGVISAGGGAAAPSLVKLIGG